jgi:hypothetical protein
MEIVTLNNFSGIDLKSISLAEVNSLDDIIKRKRIQESLKDKGIAGFKEITNLNNISFGHFIIIEKILALEGIETDDRVKMLSPIILRPLNELKLDNEDKEKEKKHARDVFNEPIGNIYGAFNRFMEIRKTYLYKTYNGVIYGVLDEDAYEDEDESINVGSTQSAREFHSKKFFWNSMISLVANGDIFKFNEAVDLMMSTVMPFFAEKRSLEIIENLERKQSRI